MKQNIPEADVRTVETITSKFASIQWRDFTKGLLIAIIIPVIGILYEAITHWFNTNDPFLVDWKGLAKAAFYGFTAYISKNFFEPSKTIVVVEPPITSK